MTDLSHDAPDDGFHEIQLSGKQLVFLFMATTVVSVVIFLCGVLVGRGVRGEAASAPTTPRRRPAGGPSAGASGQRRRQRSSTPPAPADKRLELNERLGTEKPTARS